MNTEFDFEIMLCGVKYSCRATCFKSGLFFQYAISFALCGEVGRRCTVIVRPARNDSENWYFTCENGENAECHYPLSLLERFGMEVDKHNLESMI